MLSTIIETVVLINVSIFQYVVAPLLFKHFSTHKKVTLYKGLDQYFFIVIGMSIKAVKLFFVVYLLKNWEYF